MKSQEKKDVHKSISEEIPAVVSEDTQGGIQVRISGRILDGNSGESAEDIAREII